MKVWNTGFLAGLLLFYSTTAFTTERKLVLIPDGDYIPLYNDENEILPSSKKEKTTTLKKGPKIKVNSFYLDQNPVTRKEYLEFLKKNIVWHRSKSKSIFADDHYLNDWKSDLDPGTGQPLQSPVRYVSWFAARAFCESENKRLPTINEWEYAASSFSNKESIKSTVLKWYSKATPKVLPIIGTGPTNKHGVQDLHGLVWEWVEDFNSNLVTGESRGDGSLEKASFCGASGLGANDFEDYAAFMRYGLRSSLKGNFGLSNLGFRCARDRK